MDRESFFLDNFRKSLSILLSNNDLKYNTLKFKLTPTEETNKPSNLGGDFLRSRHWSRKAPGFDRSDWSFHEVLDIISLGMNLFPLWIELYLYENYIELKFSKRFRKYRDLHNVQYGLPPFKIIDKYENNIEKQEDN